MSSQLKGWVYLLITVFFFSTIEVVTKPFAGVFDPLQITFLRFFFGGLVLLIFLLISGKMKTYKLTVKSLVLMGLIGSLNSVLSMSLLQLSVKFSNASTAAILISANPIFVVILASLILKEKITLRKVVSMAVGALGIIIILMSNSSGDSTLGLLYGVLATISFALYTVLVKKYVKEIPSIIFVTFSFLLSSIIFYIVLLIFKIPVFTFEIESFNVIWMLAYISIFVTGIAYITFFKAFEVLDASKGSFSYLLKPVISMIMAYLFLNEIPNNMKLIGTVFIILSVAIIALKGKKNKI
ncbi:DMT family transporter [Oceanotoga sp. DSM 15011]|uniref:DMT family transporter n=1 Tax=Oceanotoga TaxID=1255275 RepID=UPI0013050315|nr:MULTISPECIES: DMT family transporter [Oceanotoga]MDO7976399.1 DMT family transporter [Oceanotoga teriensis]UYO98813.1 DMT family transporter [Oceanotoga sp. DSM 15011]